MGEPTARCRARSRALEESLHGTASTVRSWVLLEEPGPWGAEALRDSRLDAGLTARLTDLAARLRLRVVLIRRVFRQDTPDRRACYLARTDVGAEWVQRAELDAPGEVLDLDLDALARGRSPGLQPVTDPLYLVCTQGRHDPCCAELGRPVVRALAGRFPERTWEVSHIGGDRFAANVLVLPQSVYYGRVPPEAATALAESCERGEIEPEYLRGRCGYDFATQAAECLLRERTGIRAVNGLELVRSRRDGDETEVIFAGSGGHYRVRVRTGATRTKRRLTCAAEGAAAPPEHHLVELEHEPA